MFIIEEVRRNDESKSWNPVFQKINIETHKRTQDLTLKSAKAPENRTLNRYRDVLPYDHSRVLLDENEQSQRYINANFVEVAGVGHKYILTQGPLPNTCEHFWQMIWEQNTTSIIMLNKVLEKNAIKCHPYWPMGESEVVQFGLYSITNEHETMKSSYIVRDFTLKNEKLGESRSIKHFHYVMWPDFGVPDDPESFLRFLYEIQKSDAFDDSTGCPVVHCSAGIGRSGTFCLVDSALTKVEKEKTVENLSIKDMLLELRSQRVGLIQTPDQLRFSYLAIIYGVHQLLPEAFEDLEEDIKANGESEEESEPPPLPPRPKRNNDIESQGLKREGEKAVADENQRQKKMYKELNNLEDSSDGSEEDELIDLDASDIDLDDDDQLSSESEPPSPSRKPLPPLPKENDIIQPAASSPHVKTKIVVTDTVTDTEHTILSNSKTEMHDIDKNQINTTDSSDDEDNDGIVIPGPSTASETRIGSKASDLQAQEHRKRRLEKKENTAEIVKKIKQNIIAKEHHAASQTMWIKSAIAVGVCVGLFACYKIVF